MAKQIKEATETIVKVVRISGKTKPLAINGKENTDNVVIDRKKFIKLLNSFVLSMLKAVRS